MCEKSIEKAGRTIETILPARKIYNKLYSYEQHPVVVQSFSGGVVEFVQQIRHSEVTALLAGGVVHDPAAGPS